MKIVHRIEQDVAIVAIDGSIIFPDANEISGYISKLMEALPMKGIALDFTQVSFVDSQGVAVLIGLQEGLDTQKIPLAFFAVTKKILRILGVIGLDTLLKIYETSNEAVAFCLEKKQKGWQENQRHAI